MPEIQLVNESGYDALLTLAESEPQLFIRGNPEELRRRMERAGRVEHGPDAELYGERSILPVSLADLNRLQKDGPTSDAEYAPSMRYAAGSSVSRLLAAVWDVFLDGNEHLRTTKDANDMMTALNLRAATLSFDFLDYDELRSVVEEAKPPKGP